MTTRILRAIGPCLWSLALLVGTWAVAGDLQPGDPIPVGGPPLVRGDGRTIELDGLLGDAGTLVFFSSAGCPEARNAYARLESIAEGYRQRGFSVVQVGVGDAARGSGALGVPESSFPFLFDVGGGVANRFGAAVVPEVFLFDAAGRLAYRGAIDDQPFGSHEPALNYLRNAFEALESKERIDVQVTTAAGCSLPRTAGD